MVKEVERNTSRPFAQLKGLYCKADLDEISPSWHHVHSLESLTITATGKRGTMASISNCHNLRKLVIYANRVSRVYGEELVALAQGCCQLQRLQIEADCIDTEAIDLTDAHMEIMASALHDLRLLYLLVNCQLSSKSLISLGLHCPDLEKCKLGGRFDLSYLRSVDRVLFPKIRSLTLGALEGLPLDRYVSSDLLSIRARCGCVYAMFCQQHARPDTLENRSLPAL